MTSVKFGRRNPVVLLSVVLYIFVLVAVAQVWRG